MTAQQRLDEYLARGPAPVALLALADRLCSEAEDDSPATAAALAAHAHWRRLQALEAGDEGAAWRWEAIIDAVVE